MLLAIFYLKYLQSLYIYWHNDKRSNCLKQPKYSRQTEWITRLKKLRSCLVTNKLEFKVKISPANISKNKLVIIIQCSNTALPDSCLFLHVPHKLITITKCQGVLERQQNE